MRDRMLAGDLHIADDPQLAEENGGDDVQRGPNLQLLTPLHPLEPGPRAAVEEA